VLRILQKDSETKVRVMMPDKVIYTDGRDVTVTDSTLKIKNKAYHLSGITKLRMWTIRPERWPGILLMLVGIAAAVCGWLAILPPGMNLQTKNGVLSANVLALWIGAGLFLIGLLAIAFSRERYAVRIATAEGEKNAIVSGKREYIAQIVDAMNRSFNFGTAGHTFVPDENSTIVR
jgi:hypothetical protein